MQCSVYRNFNTFQKTILRAGSALQRRHCEVAIALRGERKRDQGDNEVECVKRLPAERVSVKPVLHGKRVSKPHSLKRWEKKNTSSSLESWD